MRVFRDVETGRFVSAERGIEAEKTGDPSIISQVFNSTQKEVNDIDFSYEIDFSYLDVYDIDFETSQ